MLERRLQQHNLDHSSVDPTPKTQYWWSTKWSTSESGAATTEGMGWNRSSCHGCCLGPGAGCASVDEWVGGWCGSEWVTSVWTQVRLQ
jgi:hypothetical protein